MEKEKIVRSKGRRRFIKFRKTSEGIVAYLPDGVSRRTFESWDEAEEYVDAIS